MGDPVGTDPTANTGAAIENLVERFERNIDAYRQGKYNETLVRREFIDPMFAALGWDIDNRAGYAEAYRDVIHEDAIKVGGATKAPDYCFRVGGTRKFFVEAKKPAVDIARDTSPAYQLRRYGWSAKLPLSILTDFEEFAVYDCRIRPKQGDKASTARTMYFTFDTYAEHWDEISAIFAKQAVLQGSFDKYVIGSKKSGTAEVDAEFLREIEKWREALARNIARRNPALGVREINFAVQRTIDRIIFLRMCEDRGAEDYGRLQALMNGPDVYGRLMQMFRAADDRYNSGLFHFNAETGRDRPPDTLTPDLKIDDKALKEIFKGLYYPDSPYEFSVLPADILGNVYEQFLGKVIHLTKTHQARVEEKPEVKKAGGVYYTPKYIVDYIVKHTVGKLIGASDAQKAPGPDAPEPSVVEKSPEGTDDPGRGRKAPEQVPPKTEAPEGRQKQPAPKTPNQIAKLKILDPACGSGSFLVGAYKYLLDYHRDWYRNEENGGPQKHTKEIYQGHGGQWYLTTGVKKRILLNNIHGVDIDSQAVEVTKLNLLLCALENENQNTIGQLSLIHERVLPDLSNNIKCGNSLIGSDFYQGQQLALFDTEAQYKINAFDWETEFPEAFKGKTPGFDAVIGNPPYIRIQQMMDTQSEAVSYFGQKYVAAKGNYDIYAVFIEKGLSLLQHSGRLGYICPHKFFNAKYGEHLRRYLSDCNCLSEVVHFGHQQVFSGATTYTCLLFLDRGKHSACNFRLVDDLEEWRVTGNASSGQIPLGSFGASDWHFRSPSANALLSHLEQRGECLAGLADRMAQGIRTSANPVYVLDIISRNGPVVSAKSAQLEREVTLEKGLLLDFLQGRGIKPYVLVDSGKVVIVPYELIDARTILLTQSVLKKKFPRTYEYLLQNKGILESREKNRMQGQGWYGYVYPKNLEVMRSPKILVPDIADRASFALDEEGRFAFTSGYALILNQDVPEALKYVLGLLNSKPLDFYLKSISTTMRGGFFRYFTQYLTQLPIRRIDFTDATDKSRHDVMVELVERMLGLHKSLAAAKTDHDKTLLQRQIKTTDHQIDKLVYELYGLSDDEIAIVEGAT